MIWSRENKGKKKGGGVPQFSLRNMAKYCCLLQNCKFLIISICGESLFLRCAELALL